MLSRYYIEEDLLIMGEKLQFFLDKLEYDQKYHEDEFWEAVYQYNLRKDDIETNEDFHKTADKQNAKSNAIRNKIKYNEDNMAARFELYELRASYVGPMTKRFIERALRNLISEIPGTTLYNKKIGELLRLI